MTSILKEAQNALAEYKANVQRRERQLIELTMDFLKRKPPGEIKQKAWDQYVSEYAATAIALVVDWET